MAILLFVDSSPAGASTCPRRARLTKTVTDVRMLVSAVVTYRDHAGTVPPSLNALLAVVKNDRGKVAGPFLAALPAPAAGWTPYAYVADGSGGFTISTRSDDDAATAHGGPEGSTTTIEGDAATSGVVPGLGLLAVIALVVGWPWVVAWRQPRFARRTMLHAAGVQLALGIVLTGLAPLNRCEGEGGSLVWIVASWAPLVILVAIASALLSRLWPADQRPA